jgi:hypothetical protein
MIFASAGGSGLPLIRLRGCTRDERSDVREQDLARYSHPSRYAKTATNSVMAGLVPAMTELSIGKTNFISL